MTILSKIIEHKRTEVKKSKTRISVDALADRARSAPMPRGFTDKLIAADRPVVIAELKRRSPSRGLIREDFDPRHCAIAYQQGGAAALSVLTDLKFFGGKLEDLVTVRESVPLPILRKDFLIDPYQVDEARVAGADAVLLIIAALERDVLIELNEYAIGLGLDVLVEVHSRMELDIALSIGATLVGINNRDLRTFKTDLSVTEQLAKETPSEVVVVAESGIASYSDVTRLTQSGAKAFLVGESLMRQSDPSLALRQLRGTA